MKDLGGELLVYNRDKLFNITPPPHRPHHMSLCFIEAKRNLKIVCRRQLKFNFYTDITRAVVGKPHLFRKQTAELMTSEEARARTCGGRLFCVGKR